MNEFGYERPEGVDEAVAAVAERPGAEFLGGGTNLVDNLKLGVAHPDLLVDVTALPLDFVEPFEGGVRIGALARNSDLAASPIIRERYPALSEALLAGASGQLRNLATTAGNLLQRTRCPYFRDPTSACNKREPGSGCSAIGGHERHLAILGASPSCVATHPSDMAVAMACLDAVVVIAGPDGERRLPVTELHRLPAASPDRDTVLEHGELITSVELPELPLAANSAYRKVRERASYAFALVSVAAAIEVDSDGRVTDVRIALGGVAHKPWRAERAERALVGEPASEQAFRAAAELELSVAEPLAGNGFKVAMARNTIVATLRGLTAEVS